MKLLIMSLMSLVFFQSVQAQDLQHDIVLSNDDVQVRESYNYNFGFVKVGHSETAYFRLRNNGSYPIYIQSIDISGSAFMRKENCPNLLWPGQRCRINVIFKPMEAKSYHGRLDLELIGHSDFTVHLRGWGYK